MTPPRVWLSWSSGKDSAWALHVLRQTPSVSVVGLLTVLNRTHDRVAMHAVRRELVQAQADALGLPLQLVELDWPSSNAAYETAMRGGVAAARAAGVTHFAFGDLFLEDVRAYRVKQLSGTGLEPLFPLWGLPTRALAETMIDAGLRALVTCVDPKQAPRALAGRAFDRALLDELPRGADPCFERGEAHTFAHAGPMFRRALDVRVGPVVERDGFVFADVVKVA